MGSSATVTITNCYNSGSVTGTKNSAAISAWLGSKAVVTSCYNIGTVSGNDRGKSFARFSSFSSATFTNCCQLDEIEAQSNITAKSSTAFASGEAAYLLNGSVSGGTRWYQTINTDSYPVPVSTHGTVYAGMAADTTCTGDTTLSYSNDSNALTGKITHTESTDYQYDGSQHWTYCTACKERIGEKETHDEAGTNGACSVCGYQALAVKPTTGDGTSSNPYQISSAEELLWFANVVNGTSEDGTQKNMAAYATLTADIDLSTVCDETLGSWTPIGSNTNRYTGTFDGNGHTISSLYISESSGTYQGLFGCVRGTVKDVTVTGSVKGYQYIGGIAGYVFYGTVTGCTNSCAVTGSYTYVGGIAGNVAGGTVAYCTNSGTVTGSDEYYVAGIAGVVRDGTVSYCANSGAVTGRSSYVGGITGRLLSDTGTISACWNIGAVSGGGSSTTGALAGYIDKEHTIQDCYYQPDDSYNHRTGNG